MAVSSIKGCWFKFSARLRELRESLDAETYYNHQHRNEHCNSNPSRSTIHQLVRNCDKSSAKEKRNNGNNGLNTGVVVGGTCRVDKSSHRNHHQNNNNSNNHHHHHCINNNNNNNRMNNAAGDFHPISGKYIQSPRQLPPGFCKKKTSQGQVYFVDPRGHKYWYDPSVPKELLNASLDLDSIIGRLSNNWETRQTSNGKTYFVNHVKKTTQFTDPRLIVYKDYLMNYIKHAQQTAINRNTNNNLTTTSVVTIATPLNTSNSRYLNNSGSLSPNNHATATNSNQFSNFGSRNCSECHNRLPPSSAATNKSSNLSRNQFCTGTLDLHRSHNNTNRRHQRNLLSGSHHNLTSVTNQSNTLTGPPPAWFQIVNSANGITNRNQTSDGHHNSTLPPSNTCHHDSHRTSTNVQRSSQQTDFSSGSISNLFPLSSDAANANANLISANQTTSNNISPHLDKQIIPAHPKGNKELYDKISILRQELLKQQVIAHPCRIDISRKRIFEESFRVVSQMQPRDLKKRLLVKFKGEEGLDYGGVAREWFFLLSREILNPVHGLFQYTSDDIYNLQINPDSGIVYREHLSYFNFCGRVIGMAVFHGHFIEGHFTLPFYKMLLRKAITLSDIELVDPELYRSLCWILDNDITNVIDTTFLVQHNAFGQLQEHELKENGRNIAVTETNKHEYVSLYVNYRCRRGIASQFEALQRGFYELISPSLIDNFDENELELLIGGLSKINIEDWRLHTKLKNCTVDTPLVRWFWDIVKSYSEDKRARLLQFVTGSPRVPIQGFKALQGVNSELRLFTIHLIKNAFTDNLPKSHTCFNRIDLPPYESYEKLRDKLTQAIEETMGFAMQ